MPPTLKDKSFGNGGKMLPLSNNIYYPSDLTENAIQLIGENDGIFDNEDYILFYAEGIDTYNVESRTIIYMTVNLTIISPPQAVTEKD
jgi:hypothetical protein